MSRILHLISKHKTGMALGVVFLLAYFINPAIHRAENSDLNFHARYYGGMPARFFGRDRVRLEDEPMSYFQLNPYQFVKNNPASNVDPDGKKTTEEFKYYAAHLNQIPEMLKLEKEALESTKIMANIEDPSGQRFKNFHNNEMDAFRHAFLAIKTTQKLGPADALKALSAHESGRNFSNWELKDLPLNEVQMDMFNNKVGIEAAIDPANTNKPAFEIAVDLFRSNKLQTFVGTDKSAAGYIAKP